MEQEKKRRWRALLASALAAALLMTWPALAAPADAPEEQEHGAVQAEEPADAAESPDGEESADGEESPDEEESTDGEESTDEEESADGEESTDEEESTDGEESTDEEEATDEEAPPEPTLEELRDQLMAILGGGQESVAIQASINRLIALGDPSGALRTYLEGMIRLSQLQQEAAQLQASLGQLETADEALGALGQSLTALADPDEALRRVREEISDQAARLMESAGYDGTGELAAAAGRALAYLDSQAAGADSADVAAILLFDQLRQGELLNETGLVTAEDAIAAHFSQILSRYQGLTAGERSALEAASQAIAGRANNARALAPDRLVKAGGALALSSPVFTYGETVMLSLADAAALAGGAVVEMEENDTVVIQAPGVVLELTRGSSDAYLNDKLLKLEQPVLSFDGVCYLPLDTALRCSGLERMTVGGYELLYPAGQG